MKKKSGVRQKILKVFAASLLLVMVLSLNAFAYYGGIAYVPKNSVMERAESYIPRDTNYTWVIVGVENVYPTSSNVTDNYTQCKMQLTISDSSVLITPVYPLTEGHTYKVPILTPYLHITPFDLYFAGNSPKLDAYIRYNYNAFLDD